MAGPRKPFDGINGARVTKDGLEDLHAAILSMVRDEVLVGIPEEETERDDPESQAAGITNAAIAYVQDNGAPEQRIPARPFMIPGMEDVRDRATDILERAAEYALKGNPAKFEEGLHRVGMLAADGVRGRIRRGVPPPLSERTLQERARRGRKGAAEELRRRAKGELPGIELATPLMDTNEMLKSITYAIRRKSARR